MNTVHKPVLVKEVIEHLAPLKNENFVDCTVGGGGHAQAILELTGPKGKLLGLDWDVGAIKKSHEALSEYKDRLILINETYVNLKQVVYDQKFNKISGLLLDLGLSSDQLQNSGRGFSFQNNEPLDMRFSAENELTAEKIVNNWPEADLKEILYKYGEESFASKIVKAIGEKRKEEPIKTTEQLSELIESVYPKRRGKLHPATKTFQALRIAVNNELVNVEVALKDIVELMKPGTRLAVITFHSLEDRIVKQYFRQEAKDCLCPREIPECRCGHKAKIKNINKKPLIPSEEEIAENPRSRSAKLRVIEKI
jgi:16S rRNA (cytosine1402-N4)-methyltransferase